MSPRLSAGSGATGARAAATVLIVIVLATLMLFIARRAPTADPFDPRSGNDDGGRALVLLLEANGAVVHVVRSAPLVGAQVRVLVLDDRLNTDQRRALLEFVDGGGLAVVADPTSSLHGGPGLDGGSDALPRSSFPVAESRDVGEEINVPIGDCTMPALQHLRGVFVSDGISFAVSPNEQRCFGDADRALVFARPQGSGVMVAVGDNKMFTNSVIRYADNGGLATALLVPRSGQRVDILIGAEATKTIEDAGSGQKTLKSLVRPGVWMALVQLALAFVVFAIARSIRPGRPVPESLAVPVAGSEFVVATGNLMQRAHHAGRAGWLLRDSLRRDLCSHYQLGATATIDDIDRQAVKRSGMAPGQVAGVLSRDIANNRDLVDLSNQINDIRNRYRSTT